MFGSMNISFFTWAPTKCSQKLTAQCDNEAIWTPASPVMEIFPQRFNLHSLYAVENCAFLDIVLPPYSSDRQPSYFKVTRCQCRSDPPPLDCTVPAQTMRAAPRPDHDEGSRDSQSSPECPSDLMFSCDHVHLLPIDIDFDVSSLPYSGPKCQSVS